MSVEDAAASPAAEDTSVVTATDSGAETATQDVKSTPAESSVAEGESKPSLFDAVKASVTKGSEAAPTSEAKPDPKSDATAAQPEADEDDSDPGEISEEDKKLLSARTQKRITALVHQRDELKEPAERFRRIERFQQETGVKSEDIVGALELLALTRSDPAEALKRVRSFAYDLSLQLGETLPSDIKARVDSGQIDEATGRELALARAQASGLKQVVETTAEEQHAQAVKALQDSIRTSVNDWEKLVTQRDPDFARKKPLVEDAFRALIQEGSVVRSEADAVALMKKAYSRVNERTKDFRPSRPEVKPTPANAAPAAKTAPKTLEEAIQGSFGRAAA